MCPTKRGSRPEEDIIELMDVMEAGSPLQDDGSPRSGKEETDALLLDDVVAEQPVDEDILDLTEPLDEDAGQEADGDVLELTDMLDENVGLLTGEGVLELTDALDDDEDLGAEPVSRASTEEISAAGRESDEEIDLAELDELLKDIENEDAQAAGASTDDDEEISLHGLAGAGREIDLGDIDSLLRELEEDGGNAEADLIPAGLEADAGVRLEPGVATVEYILSGLEGKLDEPAPTELPTMKVAVQPEPEEEAWPSGMDGPAKPDTQDELGAIGALSEDEQLAKLLGDDEEVVPQEDASLLDDEADELVAEEASAEEMLAEDAISEDASSGAPAVELPATVPDFGKSPVPEIPVGLVDWQATAAFASTRGPSDLLREPETASEAAVSEVHTQAPLASPKPAVTPASEQRLGWRIEALETLVKDELAKARTLADRMADVEVYVMAAPKPEEWTELMEAVSALRSVTPAPSVDPEEISGLRDRMAALESELPKTSAVPAEVGERLKHVEDKLNQISFKDIEELQEAIFTLGQRLNALPSPDIDDLRQRLTALEEHPSGLAQEDLSTLNARIAELEAGLTDKAASAQLDEALASLRERIAALESRPVSDEAALGNLDDLRRKLAELQAGYEDLIPAASLVSSVAAMDGRLAALEARTSEVTSADLRQVADRVEALAASLGEKVMASDLSGLEARLASLEAKEASDKSLAAEGDARVQSLTGRLDDLETGLQFVQAERLAALEERLASMQSELASKPAMPSTAEIVTEIAGRVEDKVFDRVEIVLSGRMIDQIERLENSLPDQIEELVAKRQTPAPTVDEEALAARLVDKLTPRLERHMAAKVEQILSDRLKTVGLELETTLAERLESSFGERFGADLRDKLQEFLEGSVMGSLREELMDEIQRALPKATAKVVREEIEAIKSRM